LIRARRARRWLVLGGVAAIASACDGGQTKFMGSHAPFAGCDASPTTPPAALGLDPFYAKYLDGYGAPVVASDKVSDRALQSACRITGEMISARADVRAALATNRLRVAVLGTSEVTTDIPEYADLYAAFPGTDWNTLRGLGATHARPVSSCDEQNLLCLASDAFPGETVLVQMLAHSLRDVGIVDVDAQFTEHVQAAYTAAMANGLWTNTWAATNADYYWAMGGQVWFGANTLAPVNSRAALVDYDPPLAALLGAYLPADDWHAGCY
jgi:hypothetical protein